MVTDLPLQKADFGAIYDQPDPRAFFSTLEKFDYVIPQHGADADPAGPTSSGWTWLATPSTMPSRPERWTPGSWRTWSGTTPPRNWRPRCPKST